MDVSILIGTFGGEEWENRAWACMEAAREHGVPITVRHDREGTVASVRNALAAQTLSSWLCFLDADDALEPGYFEAMQAAVDFVPALLVPAVRYVRPNGTSEEPRIPNHDRPFDEMNHAVIGTLVPRWLFEQVGGFRELPIYEDWDLWLRCVRAGAELRYVPDAVYRAAVRGDGRNAGISLGHDELMAAYNAIREGR